MWIKFLFIYLQIIFVNISLFDNCRIQCWSSIRRLEQHCLEKYYTQVSICILCISIKMHVFSKDMMQLESQDKLGWKGLLEFSLWSKRGQLFMNLSSWGLNSSKDGDLKASLSNVFQYLTTLSIKFFLFYPVRIALAEPWLLLVLSFYTSEKGLALLLFYTLNMFFVKANKIQKLRPGNTGFSIKLHPSVSNQNWAGEIDLINSLQPTKTVAWGHQIWNVWEYV